jgi:iron complex outermembrane receptor protein
MKTICRRSSVPLLALFFLLVTSGTAVAQTGAIAGTVRDAASQAPLSAVFVEVVSSAGATVASGYSGPSGTFRVVEIPPGTYAVTFNSPGWRTLTVDDQMVEAGRSNRLAVEMEEQRYSLNPITVTASKTEEKLLDAPAMVEVAPISQIEALPATTPMEHIKNKAGVDVMTTGVQSNYVVVRGFNNIFSGATLTLTDNRIARVPSLRTNIAHLNPTTNLDLARMEVVLGPGSALYGPNAANGVIHSITKSPIDFPGASFSLAGGLRQQSGVTDITGAPAGGLPFTTEDEGLFHGEGRIAVRASDQFGFKLSGQYFKATEFVFVDETEASQRQIAQACIAADFDLTSDACLNFSEGLDLTSPADQALLRQSVENVAGGRDNNLERWTFDARVDIRPSPESSIILAGGRTQAISSIDLTGIGAGQVVDWAYTYLQSRFRYKDLFAQFFVNWSDNDDTFLLRSGRPLIDKSQLWVGQLQHASRLGDQHRLIYGVDLLYTNPKSQGTINGQNESDDTITEVGGYTQWEWAIDPKLDFIGAIRVDRHSLLTDENDSFIEDLIYSPRAALVFKPDQANNFRLAFNRAYSTPTTLNYFLDISSGTVPIVGPFGFDVRAQGATKDGLRFTAGQNGLPQHMSPFAPLFGASPHTLLETSAAQLWTEGLAVAGALAQSGALPPEFAALLPLLQAIPAPSDSDVGIVALFLDPSQVGASPSAACPTPPFCEVADLTTLEDIPALNATTTNTIEVGYRGLIGDRVLIGVNGWWSRITDWISALRVSTPNVFLNGQDVGQYLATQLVLLGQPPAAAQAIAAQVAPVVASIPLGVVTPGGAGGTGSTLAVTYQNLGSFNLFGGEIAATFVLSDEFELEGSLSLINKDKFAADRPGRGEEEIPLNAPKTRGSATLRYESESTGLNGALRFRAQSGFDANSGLYVGRVDRYEVLDVGLGYKIPGTDFWLQLDVQNVFDNDYQPFVGTPTLGRVILGRVRYDFNPL